VQVQSNTPKLQRYIELFSLQAAIALLSKRISKMLLEIYQWPQTTNGFLDSPGMASITVKPVSLLV
jgi:hypothetical protein